MTNKINLLPSNLDLLMYSGDGCSFQFTCTDAAGGAIDITGSVVAQIRVDRLNPDDPPVATFTIDTQDAYQGIIILTLTGDQTQSLTDHATAQARKDGKFVGVWDLEWDPAGAEPLTICQGRVECVADVTR